MMSSANLCVIPMQDYLMLGNEARMNHPSTLGNNWKWRMGADDLDEKLIARIRKLTVNAFRLIEEEALEEEDESPETEDDVEAVSDSAVEAEDKAEEASDSAVDAEEKA